MSSEQPPTRTVSYEDVQNLARETETLQQQKTVLFQQFEIMTHTVNELKKSVEAIKEVSTREKGETVLLPLGPQLLMEFGVVNKKSVYLLLGSNISREITIPEAESTLKIRIEQVQKAVQDIQNQIYKLEEMISQREQFLRSLTPMKDQQSS
ncbi:MAG: prefoldin subunit alpha [Candidatus Hodarchaeales archaeon]